MNDIEGAGLNVSALDELESMSQNDGTGVSKDDGTKDYATGYVVIIRKLMELESKVTNTSSTLLDVKNMIIDLSHNLSTLNDTIRALKDENMQLATKIQVISEKQDTVIATTSTYNENVSDIIDFESPSSSHTRQVSSTVPACIIRSFWHRHYPKEDEMGVEMNYLRAVCDAIFPKLQPKIKSDLGILLSKYIDNYEHNSNVGNDMMIVLCTEQTVAYSEARIAIVKTMKLLGTKYAFMVPQRLAYLLSRTVSMVQAKIMILSTPRVDEIIGVGEGFDAISYNLINQPKVRKGLKLLNERNATKSTIQQFIKCVATGRIENDGKMGIMNTGSLSNQKPLFPDQSIPSDTTIPTKSTIGYSNSKLAALKKETRR